MSAFALWIEKKRTLRLLLVIAGVSVKIGGHSDFQKGRTWI
jgi:hypothetical protein